MKKIFKLLRFLFLLIIIIIAASYFFIGYTATSIQDEALNGCKQVNGIFYSDKTLSDKQVNDLSKTLENISDEFYDNLIKDGWKIVVRKDLPEVLYKQTTFLLNKESANINELSGLTVPTCRTIYVNALSTELKSTFIHEIGHALSYEYYSAHGSKEFCHLYEKYRDTYPCDEYSKSLNAEFFAETFKDYELNKYILNNNAPEVADYFNDLLSQEIKNNSFIENLKYRNLNAFNQIRSVIIYKIF